MEWVREWAFAVMIGWIHGDDASRRRAELWMRAFEENETAAIIAFLVLFVQDATKARPLRSK